MPPAVTLIELCDLADRVLTNGSRNTATILDSLTERSGILAAQAAEVDLPGPAQPPENRKAEGAQRPAKRHQRDCRRPLGGLRAAQSAVGGHSLKVWARLTSEGSYAETGAATCMPGSALKGPPPSSDQPQRPLSTNVTRVRIEGARGSNPSAPRKTAGQSMITELCDRGKDHLTVARPSRQAPHSGTRPHGGVSAGTEFRLESAAI